MSQIAEQGQDFWAHIILTDKTNSSISITGVTNSTVTVKYEDKTSGLLVTKTVAVGEWVEVGGGLYKVKFTATELGNARNMVYTVVDNAATAQFYPGEVTVVVYTQDATGTRVLAIEPQTTKMQFNISNEILSEAQNTELTNLDATVSSRATQASVDAIQNNTNFVGIVPSILKKPVTGAKNYNLFVRLFDNNGNPEDPDGTMDIRIEQTDGTIIIATTAMTVEGVGMWKYVYTVNSGDTEQPLNVFFEYTESAVSFQHIRVTEVSEFETKLDTIDSNVTSIKTKTDQMAFTANNIHSNAQVISDKADYNLSTAERDALKVITQEIIKQAFDEEVITTVSPIGPPRNVPANGVDKIRHRKDGTTQYEYEMTYDGSGNAQKKTFTGEV